MRPVDIFAVCLFVNNCSIWITGDFQERLNDNQEEIGDNLERQLATGKDRYGGAGD